MVKAKYSIHPSCNLQSFLSFHTFDIFDAAYYFMPVKFKMRQNSEYTYSLLMMYIFYYHVIQSF